MQSYTKTQQLHEFIFTFQRALKTSSLIEFNDRPAKKFYGKLKGRSWKFENSQCGKWAVSAIPSDTLFFVSLFRRTIFESVKHSDSYLETPTSSAPPTTSTSLSSTSASVPDFVSQTPPSSVCLSGPPAGLSSSLSLSLSLSLSSQFFSRDIESERGNSSSDNWLSHRLGRTNVFKQDDAVFWRVSIFNSKNVADKLLRGGFTNSFIHSGNSIFSFYYDWFVCQRWRQHDMSRIHWGKKLKFPQFQFSFFDMFIIHQLQLYRQILDFSISNATAGTSKRLLPDDACRLTFVYIITSWSHFVDNSSSVISSNSLIPNHFLPQLSLDSSSTESDVFFVERSSEEGSPARINTPAVLNSTQLSGAMARETITITSVASLEPHIVTIESVSIEPTISYGFGNKHPFVPPSLIDLNLPPNPFNARHSAIWGLQPPITGAV